MTNPRRAFLKTTLAAVGSLAVAEHFAAQDRSTSQGASASPVPAGTASDIVDTNVHLGCWPFRHLKFGGTDTTVAQLRRHGIRQAWVGSFDALLHKDIDGVNRRLRADADRHADFLVPFGAVNPVWPDWEEDLRRCHEVYKMPGIRLHPTYQGYTLSDPVFAKLLRLATERKLLVQIVVNLEDERVRHPQIDAPDLDPSPLPALLKDLPDARVHLINAFVVNSLGVRRGWLKPLVDCRQVKFDIANFEEVAGLEHLLAGKPNYVLRTPMPVDRLMFGSHVPYFPVQTALFHFVESELNAADLAAILSGNATRFLAGA